MAQSDHERYCSLLISAIHERLSGVLYHKTDEANIESINAHGLLSKAEQDAKGIIPTITGGNGLTGHLEERDGLTDYVFASFFCDPVMPKDDRIDRF